MTSSRSVVWWVLAAQPILAQGFQFDADQNRRPVVDLPSATYAQLAIGDLDGDAKGDVVSLVTNSVNATGAVHVHLQPVAGTWSDAAFAMFPTTAIALADVDGDGDLDIVAGGSSLSATPVGILQNNGAGSFAVLAPLTIGAGGSVTEIAVADVDGDGDRDLMLGLTQLPGAPVGSPYVRLLRNNGAGVFTQSLAAVPVVADSDCRPVLGDFDGDGDADAVVTRAGLPALYLRNQNGLFGSVLGVMPASTVYQRMRALDADGDGDLDLLGLLATGAVDLLRNNGGTFARVPGVTGPGVVDLAVGDFDGDGTGDLVARLATVVVPYRNDGTGAFTAAPQFLGSGTTTALAVGRIDANAFADAMVGWVDAAMPVRDYLGSPRGLLDDPLAGRSTGLQLSRSGPSVTADFDGDGVDDVVTAMSQTGPLGIPQLSLRILHGDRFGALRNEVLPVTLGSRIRRLWAFDIDGDGDTDLAAASEWNSIEFTTESWLNTAGSFTRNGSLVGVAFQPVSVADFGDLDGDGDIDLVTVAGTTTQWYANDGLGSYSLVATLPGPDASTYTGLLLVDADADGDLDIVTGSFGSCMELLLNDGTGNFTQQPGCALPWTTRLAEMARADFDADGRDDVIALDNAGLHLFLNAGGGTFVDATLTRLPAWPGSSPYSLLVFDADGDGDQDVLVPIGGAVRLFLNDGSATFTYATPTRWNVAQFDEYAAAADLDADGDLDVVLAGKVAWNHLRQLSSRSLPTPGGALTLRVALEPGFATAGSAAFVGLGFTPLPGPLTIPGIPGQLLIQVAGLLPPLLPPAPGGVVDFAVAIPARSIFLGTDLYCQATFVSSQSGIRIATAVHDRIR